MKIIQYPLPDISTMEVTQLSANVAAASGTLTVINTADFDANDYIIIEKVGNEIAEMKQIQTVDTSTQFTLSSNIIFAHQEGTCIHKTPFNQARLYRSTDNETYTLQDTKDLDWQDHYGLITFVDNTGSDDYWYKIEYWNSTTSTGIMSSPIKTQTATGYLTCEEFKTETGIEGSCETISVALKYGAENIKRNLYVSRKYEFITPDTKFFLYGDGTTANSTSPPHSQYCGGLVFADANLNGVIDAYDFDCYEEATDGTRTYVTSDIVSVDEDRNMIVFGSSHPTGSNKLVIECYMTFYKTTEMTMKMRRLNLLYAVNYMFQNIPFGRLQKGIGGWSINGVSVDFKSGELRQVIEDNKKQISELLKELAKVYIRYTSFHQPKGGDLSWFKSTLNWSSDNVPVP